MSRINLMGNDEHFGVFCRAMDKLLGCRTPHCQQTCWAAAIRYVQKRCNEGLSLGAAVTEWATTGLSHKDGEDILCNILGVDNLDVVRGYLKNLPGETA